MSRRIDEIIEAVIDVEGGYVNNPNDKGGETNFGITVAVARANGYDGAMRSMPRSFAEKVYRERYISKPKFDQVLALSEPIAIELIDTGVNMGPHRAAEFLQRWLNGFNVTGSGYADLFVDGALGKLSIDALRVYLNKRGREGEDVLLRALNCSQGSRYLSITENNKSQRTFLYGWMRARVVI